CAKARCSASVKGWSRKTSTANSSMPARILASVASSCTARSSIGLASPTKTGWSFRKVSDMVPKGRTGRARPSSVLPPEARGKRASLGARSGWVDGQASGSRRCGQPDVECRERRRPPGRGKRQMESVGSTQRSRLQREQELFRLAVNITRQLDAVVDTLVEAREDRVLQPSRGL